MLLTSISAESVDWSVDCSSPVRSISSWLALVSSSWLVSLLESFVVVSFVEPDVVEEEDEVDELEELTQSW